MNFVLIFKWLLVPFIVVSCCSVSLVINMNANNPEISNGSGIMRLKRYYNHSPNTSGTYDDQPYKQLPSAVFGYQNSQKPGYQYGKPNTQYRPPSQLSGWYINSQLLNTAHPGANPNPPQQMWNDQYNSGTNYSPGQPQQYYSPSANNEPSIYQKLLAKNGLNNIPWQNIEQVSNTGFLGYPNLLNQNIHNGFKTRTQSPITSGQNCSPAMNPSISSNLPWQNTRPVANHGFTGYPNPIKQNDNNCMGYPLKPPNKNDKIRFQSQPLPPITSGENYLSVMNPAMNNNPPWKNTQPAAYQAFYGYPKPPYQNCINGYLPGIQPRITSGENGSPVMNPQMSNNPPWQNTQSATNYDFYGYPKPPYQNGINGYLPGTPPQITSRESCTPVMNPQMSNNPPWQNTQSAANHDFYGYPKPPYQNGINGYLPGTPPRITSRENCSSVMNIQISNNPPWQNTQSAANHDFYGYPKPPYQNGINGYLPGTPPRITSRENCSSVMNIQISNNPSCQNTQVSTGFSGYHDPLKQNINNCVQPGSQSPITGKLINQYRLTQGDDLGAFISSEVFGTDFNVPIEISPTGLIMEPISFKSSKSYYDYAAPCNASPPTPIMPNFHAEGRRISDVRCYEYIWQLKVRDYRERWERQCNQIQFPNVKRSANETNRVKRQCKIPSLIGSAFIGGYTVGYIEQFPHMVALGWKGVKSDLIFKCGGSLISANFVLTAAHCTSAAPDPNLADLVPRVARMGGINIAYGANGLVFFSELRRSKRQFTDRCEMDVGIINIIRHEQYNPNRRYFDIALMKLERDVPFSSNLQPACLWTDKNSIRRIRKVVGAGWGIVNTATNQQSFILQAGELDVIDVNTCNDLLRASFGRKFNGFSEHQLCAGKLAGGVDVCQGDSGGPLQVKIQLPINTQGSMHTILGIISAGVGCGKPDTPGVYTKVTSFLDWIEKYVWP